MTSNFQSLPRRPGQKGQLQKEFLDVPRTPPRVNIHFSEAVGCASVRENKLKFRLGSHQLVCKRVDALGVQDEVVESSQPCQEVVLWKAWIEIRPRMTQQGQ